MKKFTAILMSIVLLTGCLLLPVSAEDKVVSEQEKAAGFLFTHVYVMIEEEYTFKFDEFTPEMFSQELIESVVNLYPYDPDIYSLDYYQVILQLNLKNPSEENIVALCQTLKDNEYVMYIELDYTDEYIPVYPDSAEFIPNYRGSYNPLIETIDSSNHTVNTVRRNMLNNAYYKIYYDELLAYSVALYTEKLRFLGDFDYVEYYADEKLSDVAGYVTLIFDVPEGTESVREKNLSVLSKYFDAEDILYVGDSVNAAVVRVDETDAATIKNMSELKFISDAFFNDMCTGGLLCEAGQFMLGDVYGKKDESAVDYNGVTAADARYILRYSAGLEKVTDNLKRFYYCADMNFDGNITSADARLALRTAAGLETKYQIMFGYSVCWYDPMINTPR